MTTELDVKSLEGFAAIALVGVIAAVALAVAADYLIPMVRTKLKI